MYIECKAQGLIGPARIGRVGFSKTGVTMCYGDQKFRKVKGYKYNCVEIGTGDEYWISGCKRNGQDRLYGEQLPVVVDDDVREEYWVEIRKQPGK
jgi:hypothetical protein